MSSLLQRNLLQQTMPLDERYRLAERRPLMRSVKGNKALLLTKVTKP